MGSVTHELYKAEELKMAAQEALRGLRIHAAVTVVIVCALAIVNAFVAPEFPWSVFPAVGMSLGVFFHWYFGANRGEEVMIRHQDEVEREAQRKAA